MKNNLPLKVKDKALIRWCPHFSNAFSGGIGCIGTWTTYLFSNVWYIYDKTSNIVLHLWKMFQPTIYFISFHMFSKIIILTKWYPQKSSWIQKWLQFIFSLHSSVEDSILPLMVKIVLENGVWVTFL